MSDDGTKVRWDTGTRQFMVAEQVTEHGATSRPATHEEIKEVLDAAMKAWGDLITAVRQVVDEGSGPL